VKRRLTFTFDNGPCPGATDRVLDFLGERSIKTTFFLVAQQLKDARCRALAERAHAEGHWIGNHTLTHGTPLGQDGDEARVQQEIGEAQRRLGTLSHPRRFFRPNGGGTLGRHLLSPAAVDYLTQHGFTVVLWNSVPGDWLGPETDWLANACRDLDAEEWLLLVLHDEPIAQRMDTLARFHDELVSRDVEIVQDFPPSCILMESGRAAAHIADFTTELPPRRARGTQ
jgi:peptidoglycan/xylan/chitin deacetylase (PgdA/CDA1 family)